MEELKHKTLKGVVWSFLDNIGTTGVTFIVGLFLARLLTPEQFGVIGVIMIFIAVFNTFIEVGFSAAIIRKLDIQNIDYNTTFYISVCGGCFFYFVLWFCAPYIGDFFNMPDIYWQIRVTSLMLIFGSMSVVQRAIFTRDVNFKTQTKITLTSSIISGAVGVIMAFEGLGVWSLVAQIVVRTGLQTLLFWVNCKWRPVWQFSRESFRELFAFSSKLLGASVIETLYRNIYSVIIGKIYTVGALGQYNRAISFSNIFSINISNVIQRVSFPVLSSIQNEPERLKQAYRKIIKTTMLVTFALMLGLAAIAKPLIILLIGEKWLPAVYFLQILCLSEMFYPLHAINLNILNVVGRTDIFLKLEIYKKLIAVPNILIGLFWGLHAMLWSGVAVSLASYLLNVYYSAGLVNYSVKEQIRDIMPSFLISATVALIMFSVTFCNIPYLLMLVIQILLGFLLALALYEKIKCSEYFEIKLLSLQKIKKFTNGKQ